MFKAKLCTIIISALFLGACATASGPLYVPASNVSKDKAVVYIYRPNLGYWQSAYTPAILANDEKVMELKKGGYRFINLLPGKHKIGMKHNPLSGYPYIELPIEVEGGNTYFISVKDPVDYSSAKYSVNAISKVTYRSIIEMVPEQLGRQEISKLRLSQ